MSRPMQGFSAVTAAIGAVPGARNLISAAGARFVKGSTGGPDEEALARVRSHIVAIAYDEGDRPLSEVHVTGVDGYTFTARLLAWAAARIAKDGLPAAGALAPVEAFGLRALEAGVAEAGITLSGSPAAAPRAATVAS
jgi:hypothetical protein